MYNSAELVHQLQQGNQKAFEQLFELYKVKAVRTAYLMTGNKTLADDIAQETFVQCYLKIQTLKDPERFKTWFFKCLTRIAWKMASKEKTAVPVENIFEFNNATDSEQVELDFLKKELSEEIMTVINTLDAKQRTTILLYYYNEFSVSEIATIMDCFEGTVKSRLHAARKNLKKRLSQKKTYLKEGVKDAIIYRI
ncbi:RNA polymerase sigma factor [Anaerotignum sp. MB30-C6]|uniref:RNA polymerase sigma factor n=1 Tax=Anaerotignum sp. MB30-C6 TaxID=3070814 RepID=UPI0027DB6ED9|nr:RNA polymerase sigma factor [Anaerotignum sp. MB30-C6]WMI81789.1 RNA polymerase sigma factor [Anaerotignum sp. MB30-C6]